MTFNELVDFIENRMRMSHIYQPLLIEGLIDSGGMATVRQMATYFLNLDENNIQYYEKRIKEMPVKVLKKHEVINYSDGMIELNVPKLTLEQRSQIKLLCESKIHSYIGKRGKGTWLGSLLDNEGISGSLRHQVLERSGGKCELCGISVKKAPFDVDHIIPRSKKGETTLDNLQALCAKCNRSKGNRSSKNYYKANKGEIEYFDKLVRKNIPNLIKQTDQVTSVKSLSKRDYKQQLKRKLFEEVQEFNRKPSEEEFADILEVLECLKTEYKLNSKKIDSIKSKKKTMLGSFSKDAFLEWVKSAT